MTIFKSKKSFDNLDDFFNDLFENSVDFMTYIMNYEEGVLTEFEVIDNDLAIHKWIVSMCEGFVESASCGFYRLTKDNLEDLIHKCDMVKNEFINLENHECLIGEYIRNSGKINSYALRLKNCIESFKKCLKEIENGYEIYYYFNG